MPEVQEVFRMATQKVRPDPGALDRQHRGQRRRVARKRAAVYALVAVLVVAGVVVGISTLGSDDVRPGASGSNPTLAPEPDEAGQSLSIVDVGSGTGTAFTAPPGASDFDFTLDGSMVAYSDLDENGNAQVFVMDADGSNARQLTHGEGGVGDYGGFDWSPDGSMIAYQRDTSDDPQIFTVRVSDGVSTRVTNEPQGAVDPGGWAPDGGSIVFSTLDASISHYSALSLDLTTGQTRLIVPDGSTPELSPDGAWIAFNSWLKLHIRLILANSDGSERRVIARFDGDDGFQEWSPDSTQIAFIGTTDADGLGTYVYDLATGETHFVTDGEIESWIDNDHILVS
jgi:Tol biopolymer transport system component